MHTSFLSHVSSHIYTPAAVTQERLQEPKLGNNSDEWRRLLAAKDVDTQVLIEARRNFPIAKLAWRALETTFFFLKSSLPIIAVFHMFFL